MSSEEQKQLLKLVEVAKLYYDQGHTQSEIASIVGVSRPLVSSLLQAARERGIVRIEIRSPFESDDDLLSQLKSKYRLKGGIVVPSHGDNLVLSLKTLVSQGCLYIGNILAETGGIGFGWGNLVPKIVDGLSAENIRIDSNSSACPLIGPMSSPAIDWHPNEMVRRFSERFGIEAAFIHAPAFPANSTDYNAFRANEEYLKIHTHWRNLKTAVVEVQTYPSVPDQATAMRFDDLLRKRDAVGSLLSYYYDIDGGLIEGPSDYVIRILLDDLRKVPNVVLICSGNTKTQALVGALKLGVVSQLIVDEQAAKAILSFDA